MRIVKYFKMTSLEYDLNSLNLGRSEISEVPMRPALEQNKKRYNSMEPALQEIQKAIALSTTDKSNHNSVLHSVIDEIIENMKNIDPLFKNIYNKKLYGGSYYDGLKLHAPDEYDLDLALKLPKKCNVRLEKSTFPGFVKIFADIESMKKDVNYKEFGSMEKFIDDNHFLLSSKFRDWFEGLLNKAINNIYSKNGAKKFNLSKSGPAMTLKISIDGRTVCVDLVPAFIFVRKEDWPGSDFRSNPLTKKDEFLVVPKDPPKSCSIYNTSWRLSFQEQEKDIICGKNGLKDTIRLLKLLRSHQFKETMLASYYIKTVMMWLVDYVDDSFWQNSRSFIFMMGLKYFSKLLSQAEIPYYWNNKYNLLIGVNKTTISNWSNRIEKLIKTLENKLDAPNHELKHLIFDYFGMQKLKEPKVQNGDDEKVVLEEVITRKTVAVTSESPSYKILVNSLQPPTSNENGEKDDKPKANSQLNFTQDSQLLIWKNISEYEAFGINVTRKLERMNKTQVIHAENLINKILMMGLLNQLTEDANNTIGEETAILPKQNDSNCIIS